MAAPKTTASTRRLGRRGGFTLTEAMVGLVISGILMLITIPNLQRANMHQILRSETSQIESALRRARAKAIKTRSPVRVSVNPTLRSCIIDQDSDRDGTFETMVTQFRIAESMDITSLTMGGGDGAVVFDSRGVPDGPGVLEMYVSSGKGRQIMLSAGSGSVVVTPLDAPEN